MDCFTFETKYTLAYTRTRIHTHAQRAKLIDIHAVFWVGLSLIRFTIKIRGEMNDKMSVNEQNYPKIKPSTRTHANTHTHSQTNTLMYKWFRLG